MRLIKQYPFSERAQDSLEAYADSVEQLKIQGLEFKVKKDNVISDIRATAKVKAYEDKQGIFIRFENFQIKKSDIWEDLKKISSTADYCVDEIEFCDAIYNDYVNYKDIFNGSILKFVGEAARNIIPLALKKIGYEIVS